MIKKNNVNSFLHRNSLLLAITLPITFSSAAAEWDKAGYNLVAHDEFNSAVVDDSTWIQWYLPHWTTREESVTKYDIENGKLVLKITEDSVPWDPAHDGETVISGVQTANKDWLHRWSSGYNDVSHNEPTIEKHLQKYGYFEIKAKTQIGSGMHSAWWMIGFQEDGLTWDTSKQTNEVDIFEILGNNTNAALFNNHTWTDPDTSASTNNVNLGFDSSADFHTYGFEWNETNMSFYVDGVLKSTINTTVHYPMLTMLGLYEKRHGGWTGSFDSTIPYPKTFEIEYWRAYQKDDMIHSNNEAEHAKLSGTAQLSSKANVSNGRLVSNIGNGSSNYLEFKNVYVYTDGTYSLGIDYISGANRDLYIQVNNETPKLLQNLNSGDWNTVSNTSISNKLIKGNNTIKLYNDLDYAPDIDKLTISLSAAPVNIASNATISASGLLATAPLTDANLSNAAQSVENPNLPHDITFNWATEQVPETVNIATKYGAGQGVTLVDVQTSVDGSTAWTTVISDEALAWMQADGSTEWSSISLPSNLTPGKGLRIVVKNANLQWNHYAINEVEIY